jgi:AraC family transcriptional regulator
LESFRRPVVDSVRVHLMHPASDHYASDISNIPPSLYFENGSLNETLQKLQSVFDGLGIDDHADAKRLGLLLLWELRHALDPKYSQLKPFRGGLTQLQLRRIKEFTDAHLAKRIGVSELGRIEPVLLYSGV